MRNVLLLGNPTEHSLSPIFQQVAFNHLGFSWEYRAMTVEPPDLGLIVNSMREGNIVGANVTVPYKTAVIPFLDDLAPSAEKIGAVNTIQIVKKQTNIKLIGHNTDIEGIKSSISTQDVRIVSSTNSVIGTGGASLAVIFGLQSLGAKRIHLFGRDIAKVKAVIEHGWDIEVIPQDLTSISTSQLVDLLAQSTTIVQATSVGMTGGPAPDQSPIQPTILESALKKSNLKQLLFDLVYSPQNTVFLSVGANTDTAAINGLDMLIRQGAAAFEIWTARNAPVELMRASLKEAGI